MPNINIELKQDEYNEYLEKKLAESKRVKKELSWKEFFTILIEKVAK